MEGGGIGNGNPKSLGTFVESKREVGGQHGWRKKLVGSNGLIGRFSIKWRLNY
jgi:hypothetical protein